MAWTDHGHVIFSRLYKPGRIAGAAAGRSGTLAGEEATTLCAQIQGHKPASLLGKVGMG